ncbi:MAG: methylmalonyl Co-A mutase-associated GTPase MeaB, partial [Chloroflexi bacterium]|nr:methylmalonyl Co-A mutase-associated GTPase MeaB [Chloroflexota bacterium]
VPEAGDTIQTMKAGLMEIGDIFVVNKSDRDGADKLAQEIAASLHLSAKQSEWDVPVINTQAVRGVGVKELFEAIRRHRAAIEKSGELARRREQRRETQFFKTVEERIARGFHQLLATDPSLKSVVERIHRGELDPYTAALDLLRDRALLRRWTDSL